MQYNTAMQPDNFIDMCAYCHLSTGGQHEVHCPFYSKTQFHLSSPEAKATVRIFKILPDSGRFEL